MFRFTKQKQAACSVSGKIALDFCLQRRKSRNQTSSFSTVLYCMIAMGMSSCEFPDE